MKLSKEELYKQLLFSWVELVDRMPDETMVPASWAVKLAERLRATKEALKGDVIPPWDEPPSQGPG